VALLWAGLPDTGLLAYQVLDALIGQRHEPPAIRSRGAQKAAHTLLPYSLNSSIDFSKFDYLRVPLYWEPVGYRSLH
jgi:hypothetical protein